MVVTLQVASGTDKLSLWVLYCGTFNLVFQSLLLCLEPPTILSSLAVVAVVLTDVVAVPVSVAVASMASATGVSSVILIKSLVIEINS